MAKKTDSQATDARRSTAKDLALRAYDLSMFSAAAHYDLQVKAERARSTKDLERFFFRALEAYLPDLFIEAGAKDAGASRRARRRLKDARIVAFEANPYTHKRFQERNAGKELSIEYLHRALSDNCEPVTFNVRMDAQGRPSADGQGSLSKQDDYAEGYEEVSVDATTVDAFFSEFDYGSCGMWIDVEGASREVLQGATETLSKLAIAMIEVEDRPYWGEQQWLMHQVASCFYDAGLVPVVRDFQSKYQYNVVFVRETLLNVDTVRLALTYYHRAAAEGAATEKGAGTPEGAMSRTWKRIRGG